MVPLSRPAANDEAVFIEDAIKKRIIFIRIAAQLLLGIEDSSVLVVAVKLQHITGRVRYGLGPDQAINGSNDRRFNALLPESIFNQAIEVRGNDHFNEARLDEFRNRVVRSGRDLPAFFAVLLCRLYVALQDGAALICGKAKLADNRRIVGVLPLFCAVPCGPIGLVFNALRERNAAHQVECDLPPVGISAERERPEPISNA